jgi:hypothetical protein
MESNRSSIMHRLSKLLLVSSVLLGLSAMGPAMAQVPRLISYQGSLADGTFPASDTLSMRFAFFNQEAGGSSLWSESRPDVVVEQGRFSVLLGNVTPFPDALFENENTLYLEVEVDGNVLRRFRMTSTPYALRSSVTDAVSANAVSTESLVDEAVTRPKIAPAAVASEQVANDAITGDDIGEGAIGVSELANGAVTNDKIQDNAITSGKLGAGSVGNRQLVNGAVSEPKVQNGADTEPKIGEGAVTANKLNTRNSPGNGDILRYDNGQMEWGEDDNGIFSTGGQSSSQRWKTNIQTIEDPLALVQQLRGVRYEWTEDGREDIGLIAEEVGQVVPEVVTYEENGVDARTVNYGRLVGVLVESVKQQQREIESLRDRVSRLERLIQQQAQSSAGASDTTSSPQQ